MQKVASTFDLRVKQTVQWDRGRTTCFAFRLRATITRQEKHPQEENRILRYGKVLTEQINERAARKYTRIYWRKTYIQTQYMHTVQVCALTHT